MVLWVFGYGSLVWNPGFDFDEKIVGYIKDYRRVFDLACIDHRGTPENPARTCTLEAKEGAVCWGAAYCVRGGIDKERAAMQYLERRECEYDLKSSVDFYKDGDDLKPTVTGVLVFTSTPDKEANRYYLGPAPLEEMAKQIATANGPCGNNKDYLFSLEKAMFSIGHEDDYVIELANEVRKVLGRLKEKIIAGPHISLMSHHPLLQVFFLGHENRVASASRLGLPTGAQCAGIESLSRPLRGGMPSADWPPSLVRYRDRHSTRSQRASNPRRGARHATGLTLGSRAFVTLSCKLCL